MLCFTHSIIEVYTTRNFFLQVRYGNPTGEKIVPKKECQLFTLPARIYNVGFFFYLKEERLKEKLYGR